ncbi:MULTISPECIES: hypothetical protein [Maribacter]|jgi:hypothetical protein|uniref:Muconolactone delta-isomerase n=1 Tax=Maribacter stanieri TaxID=440514 RepID=A0A1I6IBP5_9FLAO|nr:MULTISPECIES: hypothetical protein [Maribacter]SFR64108.1 hypothetical protein SAMN04488010_1439 [Maribacter stanieri]|tara:strand:- start:200 stop:610 length:411 start_codon:yes stop_codon:yes gene_type:complete
MKNILFVALVMLCISNFTQAQSTVKNDGNKEDTEKMLLTIFLKHDQSMNLSEIEDVRNKQGFYKSFPPEGVSVVNWYVVMGIGQMVVLELPASKLRDVNLAIEKTAWKAFKSEIYPTYDLYPLIEEKLDNKSKVSY